MANEAQPDHQDPGSLDSREQRRNNVLSILYHELSQDGDDGAVVSVIQPVHGVHSVQKSTCCHPPKHP